MLPHGQPSSLPVGNRQAWRCGEMPDVQGSLKGNVKPACQAMNVACRTCKTAHLLSSRTRMRHCQEMRGMVLVERKWATNQQEIAG